LVDLFERLREAGQFGALLVVDGLITNSHVSYACPRCA
jgi:hypothetical protein